MALAKVGLDPAKDVQWTVNVGQPDLMKMLGQKQLDVTDLAYQFGFFAQNNKWGPIVANGDEVAPGTAIADIAVRKDYLQKNRDVVIRYAMAYLQGVKEFNAAAAAPTSIPDIVEILARTTALNKPELIKAIAPHWSYINEDGAPAGRFDHEDAGLLEQQGFPLRREEGTREQLFDLSVARSEGAPRSREAVRQLRASAAEEPRMRVSKHGRPRPSRRALACKHVIEMSLFTRPPHAEGETRAHVQRSQRPHERQALAVAGARSRAGDP